MGEQVQGQHDSRSDAQGGCSFHLVNVSSVSSLYCHMEPRLRSNLCVSYQGIYKDSTLEMCSFPKVFLPDSIMRGLGLKCESCGHCNPNVYENWFNK